MRFAFALLAAFAVVLFIACDETTEPDCQAGQCDVNAEGGAPLNDGAPPVFPTNDTGIVDPLPFDAGTQPTPTCKGLFELCSAQECCSPYACTNGTCR